MRRKRSLSAVQMPCSNTFSLCLSSSSRINSTCSSWVDSSSSGCSWVYLWDWSSSLGAFCLLSCSWVYSWSRLSSWISRLCRCSCWGRCLCTLLLSWISSSTWRSLLSCLLLCLTSLSHLSGSSIESTSWTHLRCLSTTHLLSSLSNGNYAGKCKCSHDYIYFIFALIINFQTFEWILIQYWTD